MYQQSAMPDSGGADGIISGSGGAEGKASLSLSLENITFVGRKYSSHLCKSYAASFIVALHHADSFVLLGTNVSTCNCLQASLSVFCHSLGNFHPTAWMCKPCRADCLMRTPTPANSRKLAEFNPCLQMKLLICASSW